MLGPAAKAAGPVVDAALMADGLWEWSQTGSSDKFGQACLGVLGGILGGIVGGTVGAFGGPLIGAAGAGIGAALGSAAGESLYGALDKWFDWATGSEGGMLGIGEWGDAGLNPGIGDNFDAARNWTPPRVDPLILDLDGDGVETLGINTANPTLFDGNADGVRTATGWVKADDGFLVLDRNGNGVIDNGRELFGDATPLPGGGAAVDGFAALAQEDTNNDGVVDSQDARFAHLRVWRDLNGDGISQSGELFTLADLGIVSLNTAKTGGTTLLANGNLISGQGSYTRADGSDALMVTSAMNDVDLVQNPFISQFTDSIPITAEAEALPNVGGAGQVRSLREAASLSPEVLSLLSAYAAAGTREGQRQQLDGLLAAWSDTSAMATTATGAYAGHTLHISFQGVSADSAEHQAWLTKLTILERFNGQTFRPVPEGTEPVTLNFQTGQMALLEQSYQALKESVYQNTVLQTRLKPLLATLSLQIDGEGLCFDATTAIAELNSRVAADARAGLGDFIDMFQASKGRVWYQDNQLALALANALHAQPDLSVLHGMDGLVFGAAGQAQLQAQTSGSIVLGADSSERLAGNTGHDILLGGAGNDTLSGGNGDDILSGGAGDDVFYGGAGDDVFVFNLGDGQDVIYTDDAASTGDTLALGAGIGWEDVRLSFVFNSSVGRNNLILHAGTDGGQVTLDRWYHENYAAYRLDRVSFADGTSMSMTELTAQKAVLGTDGSDNIAGILSDADWFDGGAGDDVIRGNEGNDTLWGGAGNDTLSGGNGNDILSGGTGNDVLYGGAGDDVFRFNLGDGQDVIAADDAASTGDTLAFGAGIGLADVQLSFVWNSLMGRNNLIVHAGSGGDQITLDLWYHENYAAYRLDRVSFADGTSMSMTELTAQKAVLGTDGSDNIAGILSDADWFDGGAGDDVIRGNEGNDTLWGGAGNDTLSGGNGSDILSGGTGNDVLYGGAGDDVFFFAGTLDAETNVDRITDFVSGQDKLHLSRSIFAALPESGVLSDSLFAANATGSALDDTDYILYNTTTGALLYDADGSGEGVAMQFATLSNKPEVKATDFVVVG